MQKTLGLKHFALNHIGGAFLAFGMLVSSLTAAATLSVTGDFPSRGHAESARVATSGLTLRAAAAVAEQRQLQMDRNDFVAWHRQTASVVATSSTNAAAGAQRRELLMERAEYSEWRQHRALPSAATSTQPLGPALQPCLTVSECPDTARITLWDLRERRMTRLLATPRHPGFRGP